jgi:hypothetical protein
MKAITSCLVFLMSLCVAASAAWAQPPAPQSQREASTAALDRLKGATVFEDVKVGEGGELSANVQALRTLRRSPQPREALLRLLEQGGAVGQLYATIGLYDLDKAAFARGVARLREQRDLQVQILFGCRGGQVTIAELLDKGAGAVRLEPGQQLRAWYQSQGLHGSLDIIGGGYTSMFLYDGGY